MVQAAVATMSLRILACLTIVSQSHCQERKPRSQLRRHGLTRATATGLSLALPRPLREHHIHKHHTPHTTQANQPHQQPEPNRPPLPPLRLPRPPAPISTRLLHPPNPIDARTRSSPAPLRPTRLRSPQLRPQTPHQRGTTQSNPRSENGVWYAKQPRPICRVLGRLRYFVPMGAIAAGWGCRRCWRGCEWWGYGHGHGGTGA